jgi:hypothetical protein
MKRFGSGFWQFRILRGVPAPEACFPDRSRAPDLTVLMGFSAPISTHRRALFFVVRCGIQPR